MIDCYCDYEPAEVWSSRNPVARKEHCCDECSVTIKPGEQYEYVFGVWDGWAYTYKTCERCFNIRQWVRNNVPCLCWAHTNMIEDCKEAVEEAHFRAPEETQGLRFGLLRRIVERNKYNAAQRKDAA